MNDKLEVGVQRFILKKLAAAGAKTVKITVDGYVPTGTPDIIGCYKGQAFAFELKRSSRHPPTDRQKYELRKWHEAGAITGVVWSWGQVADLLGIET